MRGFKIANLNIASLLKHIDELRIIMRNNDIDVLAINGTRMDSSIPINLISLLGYNWVSKDRNRSGGGIGFFIRNTIDFQVRPDLNDSDIEILTIEIIKNKSKPFLFTTWCRNTLSYFKEVSEIEVFRLLSCLTISKATGLDQISAKVLKIAAPAITPSLTLIFNQSIRTGLFPSGWKVAKVTPIYKTGEKTCMTNYRPISVISIVAKIIEKLIHNQIYEYLIKSNLRTNSQHGFRSNHSTVTALLDVTNRWYQNMDIGQLNGVVFLGLKKAFDTVDHYTLFRKLDIYGIRGSALVWINSYLTGRTQYCQVDGHLSDPLCVTTGIPQGSALGPLLFLIYINDIPQCLEHTNANMFADDTQIETSGYDINVTAETLNKDLENVLTWMSANKLTLNRTKTE